MTSLTPLWLIPTWAVWASAVLVDASGTVVGVDAITVDATAMPVPASTPIATTK